MSRDWFAGVVAALALCLAPLAATPATPGADGATSASDVVSAARGYRASLDHLLPFREHAVTRARETAFARVVPRARAQRRALLLRALPPRATGERARPNAGSRSPRPRSSQCDGCRRPS